MTLEVGFLLFPRVQQLDLTGPYEVFASLPDTRVHLVARELDPVVSATGLVLTPTRRFADGPRLDVICVPGGVGVDDLLEDAETLDFVRRTAAQARYVTSVCTGALVLGAAGLLVGRRATTHWNSHDLLAAYGAVPVHARVVRDGDLFTGGGVTAGIDLALSLAAELLGEAAAQAVQLQLEYAPDPPFHAGTPDTAPPQVLDEVRAKFAPTQARRRAIVEASQAAARAPSRRSPEEPRPSELSPRSP